MADVLDTKNHSTFNPQFNELDIESIISAPLVAASKANVVMVTGQKNFLLDYCFERKKDGNYEPIMIQMSISKGVVENDPVTGDPILKKFDLAFSVPLLCLVPLSSLAVDKVTVDFDMEITSATSRDANNDIIDSKVQLNGRISNRPTPGDSDKAQNTSQMKSKLSVNINAGPLPLPVGILTILDLYTKAIQPYPVEPKKLQA